MTARAGRALALWPRRRWAVALAVGCPTCNKLVLVLVGSSGAMTAWAPLQPLLGSLSVALLAVATVRRLSTEVACPVPARG
ncbi:hypothetical protein AB0J52_36675 [Spirillospora sp. NPDC049652]